MHGWRSLPEIEKHISTLPDVHLLARLHCISRFYLDAMFHREFRADESLPGVLKLSTAGQRAVDACFRESDIPLPDILLATLGHFYHHDLLVDWQSTDVGALQALLNQEILSDRIRFPYRFGRLLYDRFNDRYDTGRTDHLPAEDAWALVEGTPIGVYHHGRLVIGPLGVLESEESRWLPASLTLPLWHCSDTGCNALHDVRLLPPKIAVTRAYSLLHDFLSDTNGPASEWAGALTWLHRPPERSDDHKYFDAPHVVANCVIGDERTELFEAVLKTGAGSQLRSTVLIQRLGKSVSKLPPHDLASSRTEEEQLQLLLLVPNKVLVRCLDAVIAEERISIPLNEVRRSPETPPKRGRDLRSALSSLGIRPDHSRPLTYFCSVILQAYGGLGLTNELKWRLGADVSQIAELTLTDYVRKHGPEVAVENLIFSSKPVTEAICSAVDVVLEELGGRSPLAVSRLLWKFGFEIPRYDELLPRLRNRMEQFNELAVRFDPTRGEDDREAVRGAGANLFVSVEEFLDSFVSFNVWILSSDHFGGTRFKYRLSDARLSVQKILGDALSCEEGRCQWQANGENTLGSQLSYLSESVKWMKGLATADRSRSERAAAEMPFFADDPYRPFVFKHTQLWADADPIELQRHISQYERLVQFLLQADIAGVRNGLDHKRDDRRFPTADAMLACVSRLREAVEQADSLRYFPKSYWLLEQSRSIYGASEYRFRDYRGKIFSVHGPRMASGMPDISPSCPLVFAPVNVLGVPDGMLSFRVVGESSYSRYWAGYPRRRKLPPVNSNEKRAPLQFDQNAAGTGSDGELLPSRDRSSCESLGILSNSDEAGNSTRTGDVAAVSSDE